MYKQRKKENVGGTAEPELNAAPPTDGGSEDDPASYAPKYALENYDGPAESVPSVRLAASGDMIPGVGVSAAPDVRRRDEVREVFEKLFARLHRPPSIHEVAREKKVQHLKIASDYNAVKASSALISLFPYVKNEKLARKLEKGFKKLFSDFTADSVDGQNDQLEGAVDRLERELDAANSAHAAALHKLSEVADERDRLQTARDALAGELRSTTEREQQAIGCASALEKDKSRLQEDRDRFQREKDRLQAANAYLQRERDRLQTEKDLLQKERQSAQQGKSPQPDHAVVQLRARSAVIEPTGGEYAPRSGSTTAEPESHVDRAQIGNAEGPK